MKTFRFRDFPVYQDARIFRKKISDILNTLPRVEQYRMIDQIHRASLSIMLNIAEGSAKKSDADFARFLDIAIGSLNEVIAGLDAMFDEKYITEEIRAAIEIEAENLAKQLGGFLKTLRLKVNC